MISPDTDLLVRLLVADDADQARRAAEHLRDSEFRIVKTVLLETEWVLRHAYSLPSADINRGFRALLGLPGASVEDPLAVSDALDWHRDGMDFADALHLASSREARRFLTFDRALVRRARDLATPIVAEEA